MRTQFFLLSIVVAAIAFSGCETMKGAAQGFNKDIDNTWHNLTSNQGGLKKANDWTEENLW